MVFSSYVFIFAFLPVVLSVYYALSNLKNGIYQRLFLIAASLFFYGYYNTKYLILITASIAVNYGIALAIQTHRAKAGRLFLVVGILFNVGLIGYFKYYDFFVENINAVFGCSFTLRRLLLPLGISFFTFQQLSFLISVWRGEEKVERFRDYCIFVTFFPQLVAGPIVLYSEMIPQFKDSSRRYFNTENFCQGLYLFAIGAFKKAVIADTVSLFVDNGFAMSGLGLAAGWVTSLSYTFQIYFDFSGYSDMAIGLGKMFNINIPQNFDLPYRSKSISEFWRRWHMTLGRALSTYVYFPLGGSRNGLARTCFNLMLTFLVSGIWHGAAWTFILWGVLHGAFAVLERIFKNALDKIPDLIRKVITFLIVNALWVLFRAESFEEALSVYRGMLNFGNLGLSQLQEIAFDSLVNFPGVIDIVYVLGILVALFFVIIFGKGSMELNRDFELNTKTSVASALCLMISFICMSKGTVFIYFNF